MQKERPGGRCNTQPSGIMQIVTKMKHVRWRNVGLLDNILHVEWAVDHFSLGLASIFDEDTRVNDFFIPVPMTLTFDL